MYDHNLDYLADLSAELYEDIIAYLDGNNDEERIANVVEAIESYEDDGNEWWFSDDPNVYGYFQLNEPCLLMDFQRFHEAVEELLGHPVYTHQFGTGMGVEELREEAEQRRAELGF